MSQYFFNLFNDIVTMAEEGVELPDDEAAREHAVREARAMAAESVKIGHLTLSDRIEYLDAERRHIGTVRFDEAVTIRP